MIVRRTATIFCANVICLIAMLARTSGEHQSRPDSAPKSAVSSEPARLSDSSLQRIGDDLVQSGARESRFTVSRESHRDGIAKSNKASTNKASSLIGMEVCNQQNEKLGDIKDVIVDLPSGRIGYIVLSRGGFLGMGERLFAIPPSAFQISADHQRLVINADKQKLLNAPAFAKANWPDPKSDEFEAYWASDREAVGGASEDFSVGSASAGNERANDRADSEWNSNPTKSRIRSRSVGDRASSDDHIFRGRIMALNPEARTMTVEGENGSRDFTVNDKPMLNLKSSRNPHLIDFKVGYSVVVGFHEEGKGNCVAQSVTRTNAAEIR